MLIGHHLTLDEQALDLLGFESFGPSPFVGRPIFACLCFAICPQKPMESWIGDAGEQRFQALHRARPLPLEALVETLAGHVVVRLETLDVRAQEFSAQDRRLDHVEPARGEALLDGALDEEREVVQLLVRARATGSEGVRVEVFQRLDVDAGWRCSRSLRRNANTCRSVRWRSRIGRRSMSGTSVSAARNAVTTSWSSSSPGTVSLTRRPRRRTSIGLNAPSRMDAQTAARLARCSRMIAW